MPAIVPTLEQVVDWYSTESEALDSYKANIRKSVIEIQPVPAIFANKTIKEIEEHFLDCHRELEYAICFNIIAITEGLIKNDFAYKISKKNRQNNALIAAFKEIDKEHKDRYQFEQNLLDTWKLHLYANKHHVSNYKGILKFRHWLAHGRYFEGKYSAGVINVATVYGIASSLMTTIRNHV